MVVLSMFDQIARETPQSLLDFKEQLMEVARGNPTTAPQVARIMGKIGRWNEVNKQRNLIKSLPCFIFGLYRSKEN